MFTWITKTWDWVKRNTKKVLISLGIVGVAVAGTVLAPESMQSKIDAINDVILVNGQTKVISCMGETEGVDFIIKSDSESYHGINRGVPVYFSVTNVSGKPQNIKVIVSLNKEKLEWGAVKRFNGNREVVKQIPVIQHTSIKTATGTNILSESVLVSTTTLETVWKDKPLREKTPIGNYSRKALFGLSHKKEFTDLLLDEETAYYRTDIFKSGQVNEEFIIEVFGDKGGYGYLDPLVDNFDSYNNGNLSGQGSWVNGVGSYYDGIDVVDTTYYGASGKGVVISDNGDAGYVKKSFTGEASGSQVFYAKVSKNDKALLRIRINDSGSLKAFISFEGDGDLDLYATVDEYNTILVDYPVDTWIKIEFEWKASTNSMRMRTDDGTWSNWFECSAFTQIDSLEVGRTDAMTSYDAWVDNFEEYVAPSDTCTCPSGENWVVNSSDNCWLSTDCDITGYDLILMNTGDGTFNIYNNAKLWVNNIQSTSTNINVYAGSKIYKDATP